MVLHWINGLLDSIVHAFYIACFNGDLDLGAELQPVIIGTKLFAELCSQKFGVPAGS